MKLNKTNKKPLIISAITALILLATAITILILCLNGVKNPVAGFYNIPESQQKALMEVLSQYDPEITFQTFDEYPSKRQLKKLSLIFTINGKATSELDKKAKNLDPELLAKLPSNTKKAFLNSKGQCTKIPVLMDIYQTAYYENVYQNLGLDFPVTLEQLQDQLPLLSKEAEINSIFAGNDDSELLGTVSVWCMSQLGAQQYQSLLTKINPQKDLPLELTKILDQYKKLMNQNLLFNLSTKATLSDLEFYMKQRQLSMITMSLSLHRQLPYVYIRHYQDGVLPFATEITDPAIVAPVTTGQLLNTKFLSQDVMKYLLSQDVQSQLSDLTQLAPVHANAPAFDTQASDVRYLCASLPGGFQNSIAHQCCLTQNQIHLLAKKIRDYLEN